MLLSALCGSGSGGRERQQTIEDEVPKLVSGWFIQYQLREA